MKENSKLINGGFNKWMEILAGKDLPTKLGKSKNVAMKYSESNGTVNYGKCSQQETEVTATTNMHFINNKVMLFHK